MSCCKANVTSWRYLDCTTSGHLHLAGCEASLWLQLGSNKSPDSSDNGDADVNRDENGIMRQLQDLKRMVIQNQAEGVQYHAGCTAIVAFKYGNMLYVANAGDSRGVLCREGAPSTKPCAGACML